MTTTRGEADLTVEYQPDRVRITVDQSGRQTVIAMPATTAMELARRITASAALAMTEKA